MDIVESQETTVSVSSQDIVRKLILVRLFSDQLTPFTVAIG